MAKGPQSLPRTKLGEFVRRGLLPVSLVVLCGAVLVESQGRVQRGRVAALPLEHGATLDPGPVITLTRLHWGGLALGILAVVLLMLLEVRRSQRLLAGAEAARAAATEARDDLSAVLDALPALVAVATPDNELLLVNRLIRRLHGLGDRAILGRRVDDLGLAAVDRSDFWAMTAQGEDETPREHLLVDAQGREHTLLGARVTLRGEAGAARRIVRVALDMTERKAAEAQIHHLAHHDPMTDLPNRGHFQERLRAALVRPRPDGRGLAILCIDVDGFKAVNDSLGHPAGDALLVALGRRMQSCLRSGDFLARVGGDEFAIIQEGIRGVAGAEALARRIIGVAARPFEIDRNEVQIGASIGIYEARPGDDAEDMIRRGDLALYRAKAEGRGRHCLFLREIEEDLAQRRRLELDLRRAVERHDLHLVFQPKFKIADRALLGFEALLRWEDPERGPIPPDQFIPVAEDSGLIVPLGAWVLREACRRAAEWNRVSAAALPVAVNLSPGQFSRDDVVGTVEQALREAKLEPHLLELEITESVLMRSYEQASDLIRRLRAHGVGVGLDDFGTGYSSLGHLHRLPLDRLKIDRAFVVELGTSTIATAIVRAIVSLAQTLRMVVTAEGVETEAQLEQLREIGCDEAQGYLLGRPVDGPTALLMAQSAGVASTLAETPPAS